MPVEIPDGVEVTIEDHTIKVKGPKGELTRKIHEAIEVKVEDGQIDLECSWREAPSPLDA